MHPAIAYAESQLGLHKSYERALDAQRELDEAVSELDKAQDRKRDLAEKVAEQEMILLIQERGKHADMSQAGMDRHLAIVKAQDTALQELKKLHAGAAAQASGLEYDVDVQKSIIKIETARMESLGGYLHYLAAVKTAEVTAQTTKTTQTGEQA